MTEKEIDWDNIDWDYVLNNPEEAEKIPREQLFKKISQIQVRQRLIPTTTNINVFLSVLLIIVNILWLVFFVLNPYQYMYVIITWLLFNTYTLLQYAYTIYTIDRRTQ